MLRYTLILLVLLFARVAVAGEFEDWKYDGKFHRLVAKADRVLIRDGGYNCCGPVDKQAILLTITNQQEIAKLNEIIQFETNQTYDGCMCCGFPGLDWYRGKRRIALTALTHGHAVRWRGFPGDAQLTSTSSELVVEWLARHGVAGPKEEVEAEKRRAAVAKEAGAVLQKFVPQAFLTAIQKAEEEVKRTGPQDMFSSIDKEDAIKGKFIRASFGDKQRMYTSLFQIMGCLPMHWDSRYSPDQDESYEFLVRAPRDELDNALHAAARSKDRIERRGAARMIYSQHYMTIRDKTEQDIEKWMELLAEAAYEEPFPENRRLVLYRLVEYPSVKARYVLQKAVEDPDQTTRRYAIEALSLRNSPESTAVLSRVARGLTRPGKAPDLPKDYGEGTGVSYVTPGMEKEVFQDTDEEAANKTLQATRH